MATLNIRLDDELKANAFSVLEQYGVTPSDFIRDVFRYVAEQQKLPVKLRPYDQDNHEASQTVWAAFIKVRNAGAAVVDLFRQDKNIPLAELAKFFKATDSFHQISNSVVPHLTKAKEWTQVGGELQKLNYQLKYQALSSRLGADYAMYSLDAMNEFSKNFHGIEYLAHELMLKSRYL